MEIERDSNVTSGSFSTVERKGIVTHFKIYPQKKNPSQMSDLLRLHYLQAMPKLEQV